MRSVLSRARICRLRLSSLGPLLIIPIVVLFSVATASKVLRRRSIVPTVGARAVIGTVVVGLATELLSSSCRMSSCWS